jgi:polyhydroxyalkanoate synthesis repressor PhaR
MREAMNVEFLYPLITEAIRRAETLDDLGAPGAYSAHLDVSLLEERVAGILPASNPEGALARRGAVRAALAAGEIARAQQLTERFLAEDDAEDDLRVDLRRLLEQAELSPADRHSYVMTGVGMEAPARLIKRYDSRKRHGTEESRDVSLDEISAWVRQGQKVKVVDDATGADVTSQTLAQIILDKGRRGTSFLPSELLYDLLGMGERATNSGWAREEMSNLRARLEQLESALAELKREQAAAPNPGNTGEASRRELRKA